MIKLSAYVQTAALSVARTTLWPPSMVGSPHLAYGRGDRPMCWAVSYMGMQEVGGSAEAHQLCRQLGN